MRDASLAARSTFKAGGGMKVSGSGGGMLDCRALYGFDDVCCFFRGSMVRL